VCEKEDFHPNLRFISFSPMLFRKKKGKKKKTENSGLEDISSTA
jgi:hypothetical protein